MKSKYIPTIGLEIHVELATKSKMFCACPANHFGKKPNTQTCPVCLGLPGALPIPNKKAIDWTVLVGLALNCTINKESEFDRKHYFYPDLPKGYQISQYDEPLCENGYLETASGRVRITRVHLEEDTGKLQHKIVGGKEVSLVDFNRSGVPLMEIVTEPDIHSAEQAKEFAKELVQILRRLNVSDCDMEKGSMRLETNTSLGLDLGYKVEVKNINSFKFMAKAIDYDIQRQEKLLDSGEKPKQETRGWSESRNETIHQRYKETSDDYRYFPEPDIPPISFTDEYIEKQRRSLPKLPDQIARELSSKYQIKKEYSQIISIDEKLTNYSYKAFDLGKSKGIKANDIANSIINLKINIKKITPSKLINDMADQKSSVVRDSMKLEKWADEAIEMMPEATRDYKGGKENALQVLVGKVMQLSNGKADAKLTQQVLQDKLK